MIKYILIGSIIAISIFTILIWLGIILGTIGTIIVQ